MREAPVKTTGFRQGITSTSVSEKERLGTLRILEDGRKFRYCKNGGVALDAADAVAAATIPADHTDCVVATLNSSRTQVQVTVVAGTALASNALKGGYLQVNAGTGAGRSYRIDSNTVLSAAGTTVTLALTDRMAASDATTKVTLIPCPFYGVGTTTDEENLFAGIAVVDVAINRYFWAQTGGPGICQITGTPAIGTMLTLGSTAGQLAAVATPLDIDVPIVGVMYGTVGVDGEFKPVMLTID